METKEKLSIKRFKRNVILKFSLIIVSIVGTYSAFIYFSMPELFKVCIILAAIVYIILIIMSNMYINFMLKNNSEFRNRVIKNN